MATATTTERARERARRVRIIQDEDPESPREWDNLGTMVCWHSRYTLGDEQPSADPQTWRRELAAEHVSEDDPDLLTDEDIRRALEDHYIMLPLILYDHSELSMSTNRQWPYDCPWDAGQVGWIYVSKAKGRKEWPKVANLDAKLREVLEGEVETYDQFLRGEVYGFVVEERDHCDSCGREEWQHVDSCWGFFGHDLEQNGIADYLSPEDLALAKESE